MKHLRPALCALAIFTLICGFIYPLLVYLIGKSFFPYQANGSLIQRNGQLLGSELIGQQFSQNKYFWSRPSATTANPYNGLASGGSNYGSLNPQLMLRIKQRVTQLQAQPNYSAPIPIDLVTTSASGLDPEISIAAAYFQLPRIAQARHMSISQLQQLIEHHAKYPIFGLIGEARVNVLNLNLTLDNPATN